MNYTNEEMLGMIEHTLRDNKFSDALKKSALSLAEVLSSWQPDPLTAQKLRKAWRRRLYIRKYKARGARCGIMPKS